jgi:hypothetical protein
MSFGFIRGLAWAREIRFFTIAAGLLLLYTLGSYTPAFYLMYDLLPAVALYRRPADATFVPGCAGRGDRGLSRPSLADRLRADSDAPASAHSRLRARSC